jgi:EmrB/QacA subfamily drug resistance transporter
VSGPGRGDTSAEVDVAADPPALVHDERQRPRQSPWVAMGVILVGTYGAVLNSTTMGVALPQVARDLTPSPLGVDVDWVITAFLLGIVMIQPGIGWLSDRFGRKHVYVGALLCFVAGAAVSALAPTMEVLVGARFVQGLGAGAVMPVGMATIYELFPADRRGSALGIWGIAVMAAPAVGPPLGGWIVTATSWRILFVVFVGVGLGAAALAQGVLRDNGAREHRPLDVAGWILAVVGIAMVVIGARQATSWGPTSALTVGVVGSGLVVLAVLVRWALRRDHPIIEFRMFAYPTFAVGMGVIALVTMAQFSRLNYIPIELQVIRGLDAQEVGLLLAPAALGAAVMMPISGWVSDRVGARPPTVVGLVIMAFSMWQLAHLTVDGSDRWVTIVLMIQGAGAGLCQIPSSVAAMNSLPSRFVSQSTAISQLIRQMAGALGVAVLATLLVADMGAVAPVDPPLEEAQAAYNGVFLVVFWLVVATIVAALFLPGRRRSQQHQAERAREFIESS